jgi:hypothetical protein
VSDLGAVTFFDKRCHRCGTLDIKWVRTVPATDIDNVPAGCEYVYDIYACRRGKDCGRETKVLRIEHLQTAWVDEETAKALHPANGGGQSVPAPDDGRAI